MREKKRLLKKIYALWLRYPARSLTSLLISAEPAILRNTTIPLDDMDLEWAIDHYDDDPAFTN